MEFPVERHLLQNFTPVCLKCGAEIVDIHAAELGHQPVRNAGKECDAATDCRYAAWRQPLTMS